ncbi:hypothetical protein BDV59DRAFT_201971 [Aspergillus ambiguus]|uniref:uncharacterized protein n=1 Tax=Aspergillus ambiguus TaxID=176160 RepID=UPI003CCE3EDF
MTDTDTNIERCIGKPVPPFQIKLSSGDHGSIMVKPLASFLGYLSDEIPSEDLFDHEGYFNTNDTAHRVGDDYVFDGRASSDCEYSKPGGAKVY